MADREPRPRSGSGGDSVALEMLRVPLGASFIVRLLSESYKGFMTHYKGRGQYCPGDDTCELHHMDATWKGYCCAERWSQIEQGWIAVVLEISESLDQDFWGRFMRGGVWEITHKPKPGQVKKTTSRGGKVVGTEWDPIPAHLLPQPYSMKSVLENVYHRQGIRLHMDNPLPRRVMVVPTRGAPPRRSDLSPASDAPVTPEQYRRLRSGAAGLVSPVPNENGATE